MALKKHQILLQTVQNNKYLILTILLESYPILKEKRGANDKSTIKALNRIIELYEAWSKPEEAAKYKALLPDSTNENN